MSRRSGRLPPEQTSHDASRVDEIGDLAADGLLPIGQDVDVGVNTRVGGVGHAGSTVT